MHFSKRFKKAWSRSNQRMHDMLLARPPTRYLQKWPNPAFERRLPIAVPLAALRAKASDRTLELARPKQLPQTPLPKKPKDFWESIQQYQPSQRLLELSRPALKGIHLRDLGNSLINVQKEEKRAYNKERVNILAQKKPSVHPPKEKKKPPVPLSRLLPRIKILCKPVKRYQSPEPPAVKKVRFQLDNKKYVASERTKNLAQPRVYEEFDLDENFDPYVINPAALTYTATDNITKLAEPRIRTEKKLKKG